jgi:hypothetical protein
LYFKTKFQVHQMSSFSEKIRKIENAVKTVGSSVSAESCFPMLYVIAACIPVIVALVLYFVAPSFVKDEDSDVNASIAKLLLWTGIFTGILWGGLYAYNSYYPNNGVVCKFD